MWVGWADAWKNKQHVRTCNVLPICTRWHRVLGIFARRLHYGQPGVSYTLFSIQSNFIIHYVFFIFAQTSYDRLQSQSNNCTCTPFRVHCLVCFSHGHVKSFKKTNLNMSVCSINVEHLIFHSFIRWFLTFPVFHFGFSAD